MPEVYEGFEEVSEYVTLYSKIRTATEMGITVTVNDISLKDFEMLQVIHEASKG